MEQNGERTIYFGKKKNCPQREIDNYLITIRKFQHSAGCKQFSPPLGRSRTCPGEEGDRTSAKGIRTGCSGGQGHPDGTAMNGYDSETTGKASTNPEKPKRNTREKHIPPHFSQERTSTNSVTVSVSGGAGQPRSLDLRRPSTVAGPSFADKPRNTKRGLRSNEKTEERRKTTEYKEDHAEMSTGSGG